MITIGMYYQVLEGKKQVLSTRPQHVVFREDK